MAKLTEEASVIEEAEVASSKPKLTAEQEQLLTEALLGWKKRFSDVMEEFGLTQAELDEFMSNNDLFRRRLQNSAPMINKMVEKAYEDGDVSLARDLLKMGSELYPPEDSNTMRPIHLVFYRESVERKKENETNRDPAPQVN